MQDTVAYSIQLAVAPVFMLTAISAMLAALAARLARIVDRGRILEERLDAVPLGKVLVHAGQVRRELELLHKRAILINAAITLQILAATLIAATVITLFLGETTAVRTNRFVPWTFMIGVTCFVFALLCFLVETLLAGRALNFGKRQRQMRQ